jgi:hypothetical protein
MDGKNQKSPQQAQRDKQNQRWAARDRCGPRGQRRAVGLSLKSSERDRPRFLARKAVPLERHLAFVFP